MSNALFVIPVRRGSVSMYKIPCSLRRGPATISPPHLQSPGFWLTLCGTSAKMDNTNHNGGENESCRSEAEPAQELDHGRPGLGQVRSADANLGGAGDRAHDRAGGHSRGIARAGHRLWRGRTGADN